MITKSSQKRIKKLARDNYITPKLPRKMTVVERAIILKHIEIVIYALNKIIERLRVDSLSFNLLYRCREDAMSIEMIVKDFGPKKKRYRKNSSDRPLV